MPSVFNKVIMTMVQGVGVLMQYRDNPFEKQKK